MLVLGGKIEAEKSVYLPEKGEIATFQMPPLIDQRNYMEMTGGIAP